MCPIVAQGARWTGLSLTAAHAFCLEVRRAQVTLPSALECDSAVKSTAPIGEPALINSCCLCEETMGRETQNLI